MKIPQEQYYQDAQYKQLVDMLESYIHLCHFSPSELRAAAVLAAIHYESKRIQPHIVIRNDDDADSWCPSA